MNVLECSSVGDKRFSSFYAKVSIGGKLDSIENHYQNCKMFDEPVDKPKGRKPDYLLICNMEFDTEYLTAWYYYLWFLYLEQNPDLVEYAKQFDDYSDKFRGKSVNCQADVIRDYIHNRDSVIATFNGLPEIIEGLF